MALVLSPDAFTLSYKPSSNILSGGWSGPLPMEQVPACYERMLAAAHTQNKCRFWLLDIGPRNWHSAEVGRWFATDFVPRAIATLGQPLFIAYVVTKEQQSFIESAPTDALLRQVAKANCFPFYFGGEEAALAWLSDQQAAEQLTFAGRLRSGAAAR